MSQNPNQDSFLVFARLFGPYESSIPLQIILCSLQDIATCSCYQNKYVFASLEGQLGALQSDYQFGLEDHDIVSTREDGVPTRLSMAQSGYYSDQFVGPIYEPKFSVARYDNFAIKLYTPKLLEISTEWCT